MSLIDDLIKLIIERELNLNNQKLKRKIEEIEAFYNKEKK